MAGGRYGDALAAYAAEARPGGPRSPFEAGADGVTSGDALLTRSQELEDAAAAGLASGAAEVRELSTVQLAGGAALDLAAAADLLDAASGSPFEAGAGGSTFEQTYAELREVLDADPALGARDALPAAAAAAVDAAFEAGATVAGADGLRNAATGAIDAIVDDAGKVVGYGVKGLGSLSLDAVIGAFGESADRLLSPIVARARGLIKLAMKHVVKAVSKLLRLLGPLEEPARAWLAKKLGGLTQEGIVGWAVDAALDVDQIKADVAALIDAAPADMDGDRVATASGELESLAARFGRHELVIRVLTKLFGKVQGAILGLVGWAAAAVAGVYALIVAYGVWVAGDFLDWFRTREEGVLDIVGGVRTIVRLAVSP